MKTPSLLLALYVAALSPAFATQPLTDLYSDGHRSGRIFPSECCHVELPDNERILKIRSAAIGQCSAIGGPAAVFELEAGKIWLTGLYDCADDVPLERIYPGMKSPAFAEWLTGTFSTILDFRCYDERVQPVYAVKQVLVIEKGIVKSVTEQQQDVAVCDNKGR